MEVTIAVREIPGLYEKVVNHKKLAGKNVLRGKAARRQNLANIKVR